MGTINTILAFLIIATIAGTLGALGMNGFMRVITMRQPVQVNMIEALASLFTGTLEKAMLVGSLIHLASGIAFGFVYTLLFVALGIEHLPASLFLGSGFGFFHGLIVAYALMFYV